MTDTAARVGPVALAAAAATVRTVPAATTFVMRNVHVANETALPATFTFSIGADGAGKRLWYQQAVPALGSFDWSGFEPVFAAEIIQVYASATATLDLTIGGVDIA